LTLSSGQANKQSQQQQQQQQQEIQPGSKLTIETTDLSPETNFYRELVNF